MPNHVYNKIIFNSENAELIISECCTSGKFDFATLIPRPISVYVADFSGEDSDDFCNHCWFSWNKENWGTKWNAYNCAHSIDNGIAVITFETAWNVPYPVIIAFANKYKISFEHRYFDELSNFWGIENWDVIKGIATRVSKRKNNEDDMTPLAIELMGYDPESDEQE